MLYQVVIIIFGIPYQANKLFKWAITMDDDEAI